MRISMLLLSMLFCGVSFAQKYSDKIIINPKIKKQFKHRDTCIAVFDAFKDCRCFLDTTKKEIDLEAGGSDGGGSEYLHFEINSNLKVKAEHVYYGDVVFTTGSENPFPPFPISDFFIEVNKNPFEKIESGFLLKYRLSKNRPAPSFYAHKSYEFTGFINCHHITVHQKESIRLPKEDSINLAYAFLKDPLLKKFTRIEKLTPFSKVSGTNRDLDIDIKNYKTVKYRDLKKEEKPVLGFMILPNHSILNGSKIVVWYYIQKGIKIYYGAFEYQKFLDKWVFMRSQYIKDLKTKKYLHLK